MHGWVNGSEKGLGIYPQPFACASFRSFTDLAMLLYLEAKGYRSSDLVLDLQPVSSCPELARHFEYERAYTGCRVHGPFFDLALLLPQVHLALLGAEPHPVYRDRIPG